MGYDNPMTKSTPNGMNPYDLMSALQKFIRRSMEKEALYVCYELEASNLYPHMRNRLSVVVYEDCGMANPELLNSIGMHLHQMDKFHKGNNGAWRLILGTIILQACRGEKTRLTDHFISAVAFERCNGYVMNLDDYDFVYDNHTRKGKAKGRGRDFFFEEATKIIESTETNDYRDDEIKNIDQAYSKGNAWELYRKDNRQTELF
jgi:replication-associated recombination protein RarA